MFAAVTRGQLAAASGADRYTSGILRLQGWTRTAMGAVDPVMLSGVASDGRPLPTLLNGAPVRVARLLAGGATREEALTGGRNQLVQLVRTQVADAGRVATGVSTVAHRAGGYYRMLQPPSCSRCAILAGKFYRFNDGFLRHPRCDCVHIPAAEADLDDLRMNPKAYFDSLTDQEQRKIFTVAGAQAIQDGANIRQIVNARRGMRTASVGGRRVLTTTEGTTRRGWHAYVQRAANPNTRFVRTPGSPYSRTAKPRLMPEQIYGLAEQEGWGREELARQLTRNGYLMDADAPGGHSLERIGNLLNP